MGFSPWHHNSVAVRGTVGSIDRFSKNVTRANSSAFPGQNIYVRIRNGVARCTYCIFKLTIRPTKFINVKYYAGNFYIYENRSHSRKYTYALMLLRELLHVNYLLEISQTICCAAENSQIIIIQCLFSEWKMIIHMCVSGIYRAERIRKTDKNLTFHCFWLIYHLFFLFEFTFIWIGKLELSVSVYGGWKRE